MGGASLLNMTAMALAVTAAGLGSGCAATPAPPTSPPHAQRPAGSTTVRGSPSGPTSVSSPAPTPGPTDVSTAAPCPWIDRQTAADLEGNRIGKVLVTTRGGAPVRCEFHFDTAWGADRIVMEIAVQRYSDPTAARNAMIRLSRVNPGAIGERDFAPGVDGVRYRTPFYPPDAGTDWAFSFAAGITVVTVRTDQTASDPAHNVAAEIVGRF
jgi:hypothetical protein